MPESLGYGKRASSVVVAYCRQTLSCPVRRERRRRMKGWRISPWIFWGVILFLAWSVVPAFAGEQPKGALKLYTSWPMQGAMIPEGTAMKRAVDLAIEHAGNMVAGYKIEVVNLDDASPVTGSWDGTVEAENAQKAVADRDAMVYIATYNSGAAKVSMPITNKV